MRIKLTIAALILASFVVFVSSVPVHPVHADGGDLPAPDHPPGQSFELDQTSPRNKASDSTLSSVLNQLVSAHFASASFAPGAGQSAGAKAVVTIRIDGDSLGVATQLEAIGGRVANLGPDYIEAEVSVDRLTTIAAMTGVVGVDAVARPAATVVSQGTTAHRSQLWNTHGLTGAGVKVGVIDVSFDGYASLMGSELPGTVTARCYAAVGISTSNLADCVSGDVHGTAVTETIYDIAPDAAFYISNPRTHGDLQTAVDWMIGQGVDVINYSVGWPWDGPGDGTSPFSASPLNTVDTAVAAGIVWVNSAGNSARHTWFASYKDSDSDDWIEFTTGDLEGNAVVLTAFSSYTFQLRWEDNWGAATRDLNLYIYDSTGTVVKASSQEEQSGGPGHYPGEGILFIPTTSGTYHLAIRHFAGSVPAWLQLQAFFGPDLAVHTAGTNGGSITNPAESASPGLLAVGAANWQTIATIETFSSRGPTPDGRIKPDIVGADDGATASYGPSGFFGTSQASPHVAGLAVLVLERFPAFTPQQTADYLKNNAVPTGSPDPNNVWGHGFARLADLSPLSPRNVSATPSNTQATVSWNAPTSNGGTTITGYTVVSNPDSVQVNVAGNASQAVVGGLTNGISYTFIVTATNSVGPSPASGPSAQVIPFGPPLAPRNVSATPGDGEATVSWLPPADNGGAHVQQYTVVSVPGGFTTVVAGSATDAVVSGLSNGVSYTFTVSAANSAGQGDSSLPSSEVTPIGPPTAPLNVSATPGNGQVTVSWTPPASNEGSAITGYAVISSPDGVQVNVAGNASQAVVSGLTNGQAYTFTVVATNSEGTGPGSDPSGLVTPARPPGVPEALTATPFNRAIFLSWDPPSSNGGLAVTHYTVRVVQGEVTTVSVVGTSASVVVAQNCLPYSFTVTAHNSAGAGPPSAQSNDAVPLPNLPVLVPSASVWALTGLAVALAAALAFTGVLRRRRQTATTK